MASFKPFYGKITAEDEVSLISEDLHNEKPTRSRKFRTSTVLLSLSTLVFGAYSLYTLVRPSTCQLPVCEIPTCEIPICEVTPCEVPPFSFQSGYATEWGPAKEHIQLQEVKYTGAIRYNATDRSYYREIDPNQPQYVGKPSREIDKAWEDLLEGQYLALSKDEADQLDDPEEIEGYYIAEVEVMHSLHCLNAVRMALNPEYYEKYDKHHSSPLLQKVNVIHIEHCIEQLRQNIQCAGDLTPLMLRSFGEGDHQLLIGTPQVHMCRNWDQFRKWYTERGTEFGKISAVAV